MALDFWNEAHEIYTMSPSSLSPSSVVSAPSLSKAFAQERKALQQQLIVSAEGSQSPAQIVSEMRRSLDRAGDIFTQNTEDQALQKCGLWLLEIVKTGAAVLDQATEAHVVWQETARPWYKQQGTTARGLFYGAAGVFALAGFIQGEGLVIMCATVLAALQLFNPKNWAGRFRVPFLKRSLVFGEASGRHVQAEARITANGARFIETVTEALKTADHILLRLSEPRTETHWREDARLMTLVQGLLEARGANDGDFALKLVGQELESVLAAEGVNIVNYSQKTQGMFDALPALGATDTSEAAPALMYGDTVLRRGTVWQSE